MQVDCYTGNRTEEISNGNHYGYHMASLSPTPKTTPKQDLDRLIDICEYLHMFEGVEGGFDQTSEMELSSLPTRVQFFPNTRHNVDGIALPRTAMSRCADIPGAPIARLHGVMDNTGTFVKKGVPTEYASAVSVWHVSTDAHPDQGNEMRGLR